MENILETIVDGLNSWTEQILDIEERLEKITDIRKSVLDSLKRQVLDGLISELNAIELERTCDIWIRLHNSFLCKIAGVEGLDRDVLEDLLELFTLKQISKKFYLDTLSVLCRSSS